MNFLAHIHLSHGLEPVMVGNLVADGYKGKKYLELPESMQKGVLLHRKIDDLTDHAPPTLKLRHLLAPHLGRYAGVATDIYFDHFLARHWRQFHEKDLETYVESIYTVFARYSNVVNAPSREFLERMRQYRWLLAYSDLDDLSLIFAQMSRRTGVGVLAMATGPLKEFYEEVEKGFFELYPYLQEQTKLFLEKDEI